MTSRIQHSRLSYFSLIGALAVLGACSSGGGNTSDQSGNINQNSGDDDNGGSDPSGGSAGTSSSQGGSTGSGGSIGTAGSSNSTGSGGSSGVGGSSGQAGSGSVGSGGSAGGSTSSAYPSGPYGNTQGMIVKNSCLQCYAENQNTPSQVCMADFYNPDKTKNSYTLVLDNSGVWCPNCQKEAGEDGPELVPGSAAQQAGVHWIFLIVQDANKGPSTMADVTNWRSRFNLTSGAVSVCLDPAGEYFGGTGMPYNLLVNARTMKIEATAYYGGGQVAQATQAANVMRNQ